MENPGLVAFIAAPRGNQIAIALQTLVNSLVSVSVCSQHYSQKSCKRPVLSSQLGYVRGCSRMRLIFSSALRSTPMNSGSVNVQVETLRPADAPVES
jgi:hypothetical protein